MVLPLLPIVAGAVAGGIIGSLFDSSDKGYPDLVTSLSWVKGYPFETTDGVVFRGEVDSFPYRTDDFAVIMYLGNDGDFYRSGSKENADSDGHLRGIGNLYEHDGQVMFEVLFSGEAIKRIRSYHKLTARVVIANDEGILSRSDFRFKKAGAICSDSDRFIMNVIAWNMLLLARRTRPLQEDDLSAMIKKVTAFFSLNSRGRRELRDIIKKQVSMHSDPSEIPKLHEQAFAEGSPMAKKIENFVCAMVADEIVDRPEYQTGEHSKILEAYCQTKIGSDLRYHLQDMVGRLGESDRGQAVDDLAAKQKIAQYFEMFSLSIDATKRDVKRAYREHMQEVHPDKVRNLPPKVRSVMEKHAAELNAAYEILMEYLD